MPPIIARRWKSRFARFVKSYGVRSLAAKLEITPDAIYKWIRGSVAPRSSHAEVIQRLARERGTRLTLEEIYGHRHAIREDEIKLATVAPPMAAQDCVTVNDRRLPPDV